MKKSITIWRLLKFECAEIIENQLWTRSLFLILVDLIILSILLKSKSFQIKSANEIISYVQEHNLFCHWDILRLVLFLRLNNFLWLRKQSHHSKKQWVQIPYFISTAYPVSVFFLVYFKLADLGPWRIAPINCKLDYEIEEVSLDWILHWSSRGR